MTEKDWKLALLQAAVIGLQIVNEELKAELSQHQFRDALKRGEVTADSHMDGVPE